MPPANASAVSDPLALDLGDASSTDSTGSLTSSAATDGVCSSSEMKSADVSAGVASTAPSGCKRSGGTNCLEDPTMRKGRASTQRAHYGVVCRNDVVCMWPMGLKAALPWYHNHMIHEQYGATADYTHAGCAYMLRHESTTELLTRPCPCHDIVGRKRQRSCLRGRAFPRQHCHTRQRSCSHPSHDSVATHDNGAAYETAP